MQKIRVKDKEVIDNQGWNLTQKEILNSKGCSKTWTVHNIIFAINGGHIWSLRFELWIYVVQFVQTHILWRSMQLARETSYIIYNSVQGGKESTSGFGKIKSKRHTDWVKIMIHDHDCSAAHSAIVSLRFLTGALSLSSKARGQWQYRKTERFWLYHLKISSVVSTQPGPILRPIPLYLTFDIFLLRTIRYVL